MNQYEVGDAVRCEVVFRDLDGQLADPDAVTFRYRQGNGAITVLTYGADAELVRDSLGTFHADVVPDVAGVWHYAFRGTGSVKAAAERSFRVTTLFD
jgi:uncharacterized protein YfaS (alpha-2-macroglobulin family)